MEQMTAIEQDKIAEVSQICMAHSATALSMMIGREVKISTPTLKLVNRADVKNILTAFGMGGVTVQIDFKHDFHGNNLLLIKENDIKIIMDLMMGGAGAASEGALNEMHLSCIAEVMNQMMGSSAIALTDMIKKTVDINPPKVTQVNTREDIDKIDHLPFPDENLVLTIFHFEAKGLLRGIMMRIFTMDSTKYICDNFVSRKGNMAAVS